MADAPAGISADAQVARIFEWRRGFNTIHLIDLGIRIGLFKALSEAPGSTAAQIAAKLGPLARLDIPAIRNRRAAVIDDPLALLPGTSMIKLADEIAELLAAWSKPAKPGPSAKPDQ